MTEGAEGPVGPVGPVVPGVWGRASSLAVGAVAPITSAYRLMGLTLLVAAAVAVAAGLALPDVRGLLVVLVAASAVPLGAGIALRDPRTRIAGALVADHTRIEAEDWQRDTGTRQPRRRAEMTRWLREHPTSPGRASLLVMLGRFQEADREMALRPHTGVDAAFMDESDRQYRALYTGSHPNLAELRRAWVAIPAGRERDHRRECLALQEAITVVASGGDPLDCLVQPAQEGMVVPPLPLRRFALNGALIVASVGTTLWLVRQLAGY